MADRVFIVRTRTTNPRVHTVTAERAELHGDHLIFVNSKGEMAGLFLKEIVESWSAPDDN